MIVVQMDMTALAGVKAHSFSETVEKFARNSEPMVVFEQASICSLFNGADFFGLILLATE